MSADRECNCDFCYTEYDHPTGHAISCPVALWFDREDTPPRTPTPVHYTLNPEPIDVIEAWALGFNLGNVVKYVARCGRKANDPLEDLQKAAYYIQREIGLRSKS